MAEMEIPGTPQSNRTTSTTPGAAPGGSLRGNAEQSPSTPLSPPDHTLQFLIALIMKLRERPNPPTRDE